VDLGYSECAWSVTNTKRAWFSVLQKREQLGNIYIVDKAHGRKVIPVSGRRSNLYSYVMLLYSLYPFYHQPATVNARPKWHHLLEV